MADQVADDIEAVQLLEAVPVLVWASGPDKKGTYFNTGWCEFTGRSQAELLGDGWVQDVHPDDLPALAACQSAFEERRPFETEFRLRRHDGVWRWMLDAARPRFACDGSFLGFVGACTDITDRKTAEATLRASEARLQLAQEAAGFGTYDWDIASDTISWSETMFRLHAIDPSTPPDQIYDRWLERLHPEDRERADNETRRFVASADHLKIDFRIVLPNGEVRWIEGRGRMFRDGAGRPLRMIGVNFDVTEQRRSEQALRESEQRLRDIAENFPGVIFRRITYPDGRIEYPYFSGATESVFHLPRAQIEKLTTMDEVTQLIHYDDLDEMLAKFRHAAAKVKPLELEGRVIGRGGETRWVRSLSRPRRREDGALIWDGVLVDVTEHHVRETERERAVTMLRMAMEVAGIGTWEYDPASGTIVGSAVTNGLVGLATDGAPQPLAAYLARVHPEDIDRVNRDLSNVAAAGAALRGEYRVTGPGDEVRWIASRGASVRLADGSERVIGALSDVTELKRREAEREAALRHQQVLLRELNHRIKNNLQMICSVLRLQASRIEDPVEAERFAIAVERVQTIGDLHAQLGIDGGFGPIDFGRYLADLCDRLRRSVLDGAATKLECETEPCHLDLDRAVLLGLVVNELVTNAVKHAFPEGRSGRIWISLQRHGEGSLRLVIGDDGAGPRPEARGKGLGMQLVEGLLRQAGGSHELEGGPGLVHVLAVPVQRG